MKPPAASRIPSSLAAVFVFGGLGLSALALLDPHRLALGGPGLGLAALGLVLEAARGSSARLLFPALLAAAFAVGGWSGPEFRGDSGAYFAYLRSAAFDSDLDFANEWEAWGYREPAVTPTGLRRNVQSAGPALLWSPFFAAAHLYVVTDRALGSGRHAADGYSAPYVRSAALGTITIALGGAWLLVHALARTVGMAAAILAVAGGIVTSPILYYIFVLPTMAHGATFGVAAALVWAWERARRAPSLRAWVALGGLVGLVALLRWQAAAYVLLVLPLAGAGLARGVVRPAWLMAAAGAALIAFIPQMVVWKALFGRFFTLPQGPGFMDWSSPHLLDTLISADHGLFSWTPAMILGLVGLMAGLRAQPLLHGGALLVFAATAWVNGGVFDWAAGDAFGARRFDLVVPLMAVGLGAFIAGSAGALARRPLMAPALLLLLLGLWNVGFILVFRQGKYPEMAPLERLARDQARSLRLASQRALGALLGPRGRALAYKYFAGEYFYTTFNRGGTIDLWNADERYLTRGWSSRSRRQEEVPFRWALYPEACVRIPLDDPFDLPVTISARAPQAAQPQLMTVLVNERPLGAALLTPDWTDVLIPIPARNLLPGENALCLRFSNALPGPPGGRAAAAISRIQLP